MSIKKKGGKKTKKIKQKKLKKKIYKKKKRCPEQAILYKTYKSK